MKTIFGMNEFIFPIDKIFTKEQNGVLSSNNASCYYIAPYQRGYKWGAATRYEQVPQMLIDIYSAMNSRITEYYLQYITVKRTSIDDGTKVLEVIDGQQRLTTLSIIFYRLTSLFQRGNKAEGLLFYARHNSNNGNIFERIEDNINRIKSNDFDLRELPSQDEYYMTNAAIVIDKFLLILDKNNELNSFIEYLEKRVMLIVNIESEFVESEQVFVNLNDNKVPLTDTYLIKGLLLTKAVNRNNNLGLRRNYKEILDQRVIMGRTWDDIMMWISRPEIAHFFFGSEYENNGMDSLLSFVFFLLYKKEDTHQDNDTTIGVIDTFVSELTSQEGTPYTTDKFPLFNKYNEMVTCSDSAIRVLHKLKHVYLKFRTLYDDYQNCTLYNLVGFVLFSEDIGRGEDRVKKNQKEYRRLILTNLVNMSTNDFKEDLCNRALQLIPIMEDNTFQDVFKYRSGNPELKNLLLSFSVFPEEKKKSYRFDYYRYDTESWSFEHIFPQHPSGKLKIPPIAQKSVCHAIRSYMSQINDPRQLERLESIMQDINEEKILQKEDVNNLSFLYECDFDVDLCGNMALLSGGVNSALSNNPFIAKRPILMSKVSDGSFVPQHTISVFNKMLIGVGGKTFIPELSKWTKDDVEAHTSWQRERNSSIRKQLTSKEI